MGSDKVTSRVITAQTEADRKERYRVVFPGQHEMRILKSAGLIGSVGMSVGGVKIIYHGSPDNQVMIEKKWEDIQRHKSIKMDLNVDGASRGFQWVVSNTNTNAHVESEHKPKPALGITSQREKARLQQCIQTIHLLDDATSSIWATYTHIRSKPGSSIDKSAKWGSVEIRCRAVLLDEGVDMAFVSLMGLVEGYVRMLERDNPGIEKFGGLSGSLFCAVM